MTCTSPRSGSTPLCKLLIANGIAGHSESYFHQPSLSSWRDELDLTLDPAAPERDVLAGIFNTAIAQGSLDTRMFGLQLQRHSFDFFIEKLAVLYQGFGNDCERFEAAFRRTCFIHLTRGDKVEPAVSYVKAHQSGLWHKAPNGTELGRLSEPQALTHGPVTIGPCVEEMTIADQD